MPFKRKTKPVIVPRVVLEDGTVFVVGSSVVVLINNGDVIHGTITDIHDNLDSAVDIELDGIIRLSMSAVTSITASYA